MSTSIIVLLGFLAYILIGCAVRAAYMCYHADRCGCCDYWHRDSADMLGTLWPVLILGTPFIAVVLLGMKILPVFSWLSDQMFKLCQKRKK